MVACALVFFGFCWFLARTRPLDAVDEGTTNPLAVFSIVFALGSVILSRSVPNRWVPQRGQKPEFVLFTRLAIASALCEGGALFSALVFLATEEPASFYVGFIPFLGLVLLFPTPGVWARAQRQIEEQCVR